MGRQLATVPDAPIERVNLKTGVVDRPETGSWVNIAAARSIHADGLVLVVVLEHHEWRFDCHDTAEVAKYVHDFAIRAGR